MIEPIVRRKRFGLPRATWGAAPAHRVGRVRIRLPGGTAALTVFQLDDIRDRYPDALFLPFRDAGAGTETYGAGPLPGGREDAGRVVSLDFNRGITPTAPTAIAGQCPITPPRTPFPLRSRRARRPLSDRTDCGCAAAVRPCTRSLMTLRVPSTLRDGINPHGFRPV